MKCFLLHIVVIIFDDPDGYRSDQLVSSNKVLVTSENVKRGLLLGLSLPGVEPSSTRCSFRVGMLSRLSCMRIRLLRKFGFWRFGIRVVFAVHFFSVEVAIELGGCVIWKGGQGPGRGHLEVPIANVPGGGMSGSGVFGVICS